ncbi:oligoribonuclease [Ramaria rubella]|nr:oligoribonuclease [Ramaria rubella]
MSSIAGQRAPLRFADGPLVWIDCEMTGLDPQKDKILEIAVLITDGNLKLVDEGVDFVIKTDKRALDAMDEWCTRQHGSSGLTHACIHSPYTHEFVKTSVLSYIQRWIPDSRIGVLAGNSVHADRAFLARHMSEITDWLHYRCLADVCWHLFLDVSSVKELSRRWYPNNPPPKTISSSHRALDDIKGSIRELKWYRENIFVPPGATQHKAAY